MVRDPVIGDPTNVLHVRREGARTDVPAVPGDPAAAGVRPRGRACPDQVPRPQGRPHEGRWAPPLSPPGNAGPTPLGRIGAPPGPRGRVATGRGAAWLARLTGG